MGVYKNMSGEADGLILIPLALSAMPLVLAGLAVAGVVKVGVAAGRAAVNYEREQRSRREEILTNGAAAEIGSFRAEMNRTMREQTARNVETSNEMMRALDRQRAAMKQAAERQDTQAFQDYVSSLKASHTRVMGEIAQAQEKFNTSYQQRISESMRTVSQTVNTQYAAYMDELKQMQFDAAARNERTKALAETYLEEARTLLTALERDFDGAKFSARQLDSLRREWEKADRLYRDGRYEAAIASAKDTALNTLTEIYEADAKKQEWENYRKMALTLSEEVKSYLESQEFITEGAKAYAEQASGQTLESEIVGIRVADYTDKNAAGQTRYDYFLRRAGEMYDSLRSPDAERYTTAQWKEAMEFLNNDLYPAAAMCINRAIINMNNAFSRQNISEEIIDFFEEHNFTFGGYAYDENAHDKALHIDLQNEATGEELIVTLAPELLDNGDIQTHVDLKQIQGDETNEARKAYYRDCITEVVKGSSPYAEVELKCKSETRNRLSADTETKRKILNS